MDKYLTDFKYSFKGLNPELPYPAPEEAPITLAQLASHMSGMGRDWPPGTASGWPWDTAGGGPPPINGRPFPSLSTVLDDLPNHPFVALPWSFPAYSNTGIGILGMALAAAEAAASGRPTPLTHSELLARDIFGPMGLNGSHFLATDANRDRLVVSSIEPEVVVRFQLWRPVTRVLNRAVCQDMDFLNPMNPSGGQFASLSDFMTLAQTLLNARHPRSQLSNHYLRKWLRPMYAFEDDLSEVGLIWEIVKASDTHGRVQRIYRKSEFFVHY